MLQFGIPVVGVTDLHRAVQFWTSALGLVEIDEWRSNTWATPADSTTSARTLGLMVSESLPEPRPQVHLDLFVESAAEQETEVARLVTLGRSPVDWPLYPADPDFVVLADTDNVPRWARVVPVVTTASLFRKPMTEAISCSGTAIVSTTMPTCAVCAVGTRPS